MVKQYGRGALQLEAACTASSITCCPSNRVLRSIVSNLAYDHGFAQLHQSISSAVARVRSKARAKMLQEG